MSLFDRWKTLWHAWRRGRGAEELAAAAEPDPDPPGFGAAAHVLADTGPRADVDDAVQAPRRPASPRRPIQGQAPRPIRLALQGGGSHGAFTWGVLEGLLQRDDLAIEAISGTSAGALNAAVLATGWARGGASGAREALAAFWSDVGLAASPFALPGRDPPASMPFGFDMLPGLAWGGRLLHLFSPYDYNPLNLNPLRDVVQRHVDIETLRSGPISLFVTATAVRSGRPKVFSGDALGLDALLASACLPLLFQAVEIDGEPYWDGGYSGNPALYPLVDRALDCDLVVVRINPAVRERTPRRSAEILDRINEITFNAGLVGELRAIALVGRMLEEGTLVAGGFRGLRLHMVADDIDLATLPASSRLRADPAFIGRLRVMGHAAAERFLVSHWQDVGKRSSYDVADELRLDGPRTPRATGG